MIKFPHRVEGEKKTAWANHTVRRGILPNAKAPEPPTTCEICHSVVVMNYTKRHAKTETTQKLANFLVLYFANKTTYLGFTIHTPGTTMHSADSHGVTSTRQQYTIRTTAQKCLRVKMGLGFSRRAPAPAAIMI